MIEGMMSRGSIPVIEKVMAFTEIRHRSIVNNIANIETPGYTTRDLAVGDFHNQLSKAIQARSENGTHGFQFENSRSVFAGRDGSLHAQIQKVKETGVLRSDGNNVNIDGEMSKLAKNAMDHSMMIQILSKQFNLYQIALRDRL